MNRRVGVLISGSGSNLQALIDEAGRGRLAGATLACVVSNRADAFGLERARRAGIPTHTLLHGDHADRDRFDAAIARTLDEADVDLIVLAGFMRILTPGFVERHAGRLVNIHPSLLPDYRGLRTHERALADGVQQHGCTVHFVVPELDAGPGILQGSVPVHPDDTPESLQQRVHRQEHRIYPHAVRWFLEGRLRLEQGRAVLDGSPLDPVPRVGPDDPLPD